MWVFSEDSIKKYEFMFVSASLKLTEISKKKRQDLIYLFVNMQQGVMLPL